MYGNTLANGSSAIFWLALFLFLWVTIFIAVRSQVLSDKRLRRLVLVAWCLAVLLGALAFWILPNRPISFLVVALGVGAGGIIGEALLVRYLLHCLLGAAKTVQPTDDADANSVLQGFERSHLAPLRQLGFHPVAHHRLLKSRRVLLSLWCNDRGPARALLSVRGRRMLVDFCTLFKGGYSLNTTNASDASSMPSRLEVFRQDFPGLGLTALWHRHSTAEAFLAGHETLEAVAPDRPFPEQLVADLEDQASFLRRGRFWTVRVACGRYWRRSRVGLTIEEQCKRGWIDLPARKAVLAARPVLAPPYPDEREQP